MATIKKYGIAAGLLAAAITLGVAAPSNATTQTTTETQVTQTTDNWVGNKQVEITIHNNRDQAEVRYISKNQQSRSTHINLGFGATLHELASSAVGADFQSEWAFNDGKVLYIVAKNPNIGKPWIGIGTSKDTIVEHKIDNGSTEEFVVDGHKITVSYKDDTYKSFDVNVH